MAGSTKKFAELMDEIKKIVQEAYKNKDFKDERLDFTYNNFVMDPLMRLKNVIKIKNSFGEKPDFYDNIVLAYFISVSGIITKNINEKIKFDLEKVKELLKKADEILPKPDIEIYGV